MKTDVSGVLLYSGMAIVAIWRAMTPHSPPLKDRNQRFRESIGENTFRIVMWIAAVIFAGLAIASIFGVG